MRDKKEFYNILKSIDGKPYSEYSRLVGDFDFSRYVLKINQIAEEGGEYVFFLLRVPQMVAGFPPHLSNTPVRRTALEDLLTRKTAEAIEQLATYDSEGISRRRLAIAVPGQKMLPRTALVVTDEYVEARIYIELPEYEGAVAGASAEDLFFEDLPRVVNAGMIYCNLQEDEVDSFVDMMEDADQVRQMLPTMGLVSFLAEGSQLKRLGSTDLPDDQSLQPLEVDDDLKQEMDAPGAGTVHGVGISGGITLIIGDAYSGRRELAHAIAAGVYNHIPGDGREYVVTVPDAVYVAAEAGRSVQRVDISPFVKELPGGQNVQQFTMQDADPCTAQAAATVEALEAGARMLIYDESDSSSSFLSSDARIEQLTGIDAQVIPLSKRIRQLVAEQGVSIVVSGYANIAEFIPYADSILYIDDYRITNIKDKALAAELVSASEEVDDDSIAQIMDKSRWIVPTSIDPSEGKEDAFINAISVDALEFGRSLIDLSGLRQLADVHQTETIGVILNYMKMRYLDEGRPLREVLDLVDRDLSNDGLECLTRDLRGDLARPRRYEVAAALNRLASLRIHKGSD